MNTIRVSIISALAAASVSATRADSAAAQPLHGLYRITDAGSRSHVEYQKMSIPRGREAGQSHERIVDKFHKC